MWRIIKIEFFKYLEQQQQHKSKRPPEESRNFFYYRSPRVVGESVCNPRSSSIDPHFTGAESRAVPFPIPCLCVCLFSLGIKPLAHSNNSTHTRQMTLSLWWCVAHTRIKGGGSFSLNLCAALYSLYNTYLAESHWPQRAVPRRTRYYTTTLYRQMKGVNFRCCCCCSSYFYESRAWDLYSPKPLGCCKYFWCCSIAIEITLYTYTRLLWV